MSLNIDVKPRSDNKVDIYVADGGNHEPLVNSSQGYENHGDAVELVERFWGPDANARKIAMIRELIEAERAGQPIDLATEIGALLDDVDDAPEPVQLTIHWRNGTSDTRQLR